MTMQVEIAFHNIEKSDAAEAHIRSRIDHLEQLFSRLTSCRVRVDQRATNEAGTIPPVVHIELGVPGRRDIVVSHEPDHLMRKFQHPELRHAIHEAFRIAETHLRALKQEKFEGRTKQALHDGPNQMRGQVAEINADDDFGYLLTAEGGLLYFHRNALLSGDFDHLARGDEVHYVQSSGDTGPIATKVRAKTPGAATS